MLYVLAFFLVCASPVLLAVFILKTDAGKKRVFTWLNAFKRGWSAFSKATTHESRAVLVIIFVLTLLIGGAIIYSVVSDGYSEDRGNHATPAEELQLARSLCPPTSDGGVSCVESEMDIAVRHLAKISRNAPEYSEAAKLRSLIQAFRIKVQAARQMQEEALAAARAKQQAEHPREAAERTAQEKHFGS